MKGVTGKRSIAILTAAALILVALLGTTAAQAADPGIALDPSSGPVNTPITVSGTGFAGTSTITVLFGDAEAATTTSNELGAFTATIAALQPASPAGYGSVTVSAGDGAATSTATFTLAGPPSITLDPASGVVNTLITVTGTDFAATSTITLTYDGDPVGMTLATITTNAAGAFTDTFNAPLAAYGFVTVAVTDGEGASTSTPFHLQGPPAVTLTPAFGVVNALVAVTGTLFAADTAFSVTFDGSVVATGTTTTLGEANASFRAPVGAFSGHEVKVTAGDTDALAVFTLDGPPAISLAPTTGVVNTPITVTGAKFAAGSTITLTYAGAPVVTALEAIVADETGAFTAAFNAPLAAFGDVTVAAAASIGSGDSALFQLIGPATISLDASSGVAGDVVTVTGDKFAATSTVIVSFRGSPVSTTPEIIITNGSGQFVATFSVPTPANAAELGATTVSASDDWQSDSKPFSVLGVINQNTSGYSGAIQAAIDAASTTTAETLVVGPGTYNENIFIDRSVVLTSRDGPDATTISGVLTDTPVVRVNADNITLGNGGFTITKGSGEIVGDLVFVDAGVTGTTIQNNVLDASNSEAGIVVGNTPSETSASLHVLRNSISGASVGGIFIGRNYITVEVKNNFINGNAQAIISSGFGQIVTIFDNDLSGNGSGVQTPEGIAVDASGNWWGTTDEAAIVALNFPFVDFTPYLDTGVDTDSLTPGFQGSFGTLHVSALGAQTPPVSRVQEGVDRASNSTVIVHPGVYHEAVVINKGNLTLESTGGAAATIINSGGLPNDATITVTASNVIIGGQSPFGAFTITGSSIGVLATGAPGLIVADNIINPVGSTGVAATDSPRTTVAGGEINIAACCGEAARGVALRNSGESLVSGVILDISASATGTAVVLSSSPNSEVKNVVAMVSSPQNARGVLLISSGNSHVMFSSISVSAGVDGTGVAVWGSPKSSVHSNNIVVEAGGKATGVDVVDSAGTIVKDNPEPPGIGIMGAVEAGGIVAHSVAGNARGISVVRSPNSVVMDSFFDVFAELSVAEGIVLNDSPTSTLGVLTFTRVSGGAAARGAVLQGSGGTWLVDSFFDVFTELSIGEGVVIGGSPRVSLANLDVKVSAKQNATGLRVTDSLGSSMRDSFFDVFTELSFAEGVVVNNSPGATLARLGNADKPVQVSGGAGARGVSISGSEGASLADSFFDVFTELSVGQGAFAGNSPGLRLRGVSMRVEGGAGARGLSIDQSMGASVVDSFFDVFTEMSATGGEVSKSPEAVVQASTFTVEGDVAGFGLRFVDSARAVAFSDTVSVMGAAVIPPGPGVVLPLPPPPPFTGAIGVQVIKSPDALVSSSDISATSVFVAEGVHVSFTPSATDTAVTIERNNIDVQGGMKADGIVLMHAGGSAVEGNDVNVQTLRRGVGVAVISSTAVRLSASTGIGEEKTLAGVIVVGLLGDAPTATVAALDEPAFETGTGVAIDHSPGANVSDTSVSVVGPMDGIGILVLDSPDVSVGNAHVSVEALESASGVVVGDGSHGFSMTSSEVSAVSGWESAGVWVSGSDRVSFNPQPEPPGDSNTIYVFAGPLGGAELPHDYRAAVGVALEESRNSVLTGNSITVTAEILGDGIPMHAWAAGVVGMVVDGLSLSGNSISADAGKELVIIGGVAEGAAGALGGLLERVDGASAEGELAVQDFIGGSASAVGVAVAFANNSVIAGNELAVVAALSQPDVAEGVADAGEGVAKAAGISIAFAENARVVGNHGSVFADVAVDLVAWHAEVESLDSLVLNGLGVSSALGIIAAEAPNIVIEGNKGLTVAAGSTLSAVIDTAVSGTPPTASIGMPSAVKAVRTVAASGADARGLGVGASAENKFANAEGVAYSLGIGVYDAPFAVVAKNGVSATSLVISNAKALGIPAPMAAPDTEAFALGEAVSIGINVVGSDLAQVVGNTVGVQALGETAADSAAETGAPIPTSGPFALADVSATAAGIVVGGAKKMEVIGNRVEGSAEGSAFAAGFESVNPMLAEGWAFGTADVAGIVGLFVDWIKVESNSVMMMGVASALGVAAQRIEPEPVPAGEAAATTWGMGLGIGVVASLEPSVSRNTVGVINAAGMRAGADSEAGPDAALAQGVVDATGILVAGAVSPAIADNGVGVLGLGALLPREELMAILKQGSKGMFEAIKKVEEVRQCHIEVFATGIEVVGGVGSADIVGNRLAGMFGGGPEGEGIGVFAISACEPPTGEGDPGLPIILHPEALSIANADAAGIFVVGMPGSHVNDNAVDARALSFGLARALPPGHPMLPPPGPVPAGDTVVAAGMSEAFSRGITVIGSPDTEIARNSVGAHNELMVIALAADKVGTDTPFGLAAPAADALRDRSLQTLSHGGHDVAGVSGLGVALGIGVFGSEAATVKGNDVGAGSRGFVLGAAIDSHPLLGDAFTFGSVVNGSFGIMVDYISDESWVVDNRVSADADSSQLGFAQAISREDPLVIGVTLAIAVGIDNYDSFYTFIAGNEVDAHAKSDGSAFAHELIAPLEAFATQLGLSQALGISVAASVGVDVGGALEGDGNTVKAVADTSAVAVAVEQLLPAAEGVSIGQSQAIGIRVLPFPKDEAAASRVVSPAAADPGMAFHVWQVNVLNNTVLSATAATFAQAKAIGFETPSIEIAAAFSMARGIDVNSVFDSVVDGNTVREVWARSEATNEIPGPTPDAAEHLPEPSIAVARWSSADIRVGGSKDVRIAGNDASHGPALVGIWSDGNGLVLVRDNVAMRHKWGIAVDYSSGVAVERNTASANQYGVDIINGWRVSANFNNLVGNSKAGLRYTFQLGAEESGVDAAFHAPSLPPIPPVDATYNWWGHATGPSGLGSGLGDKVLFRILEPDGSKATATGLASSPIGVVYSPWLTEEALASLATPKKGHLGFERDTPMEAGWNTLSTPVYLEDGYSRLGNIIANSDAMSIAYSYDAELQEWRLEDLNSIVRPLDGFMVNLVEGSQARFVASTEATPPPTKTLSKNWNLAGYAAPLKQVLGMAGAEDGEFIVPGALAQPPLVEVFGRATFFEPKGVYQALVDLEVAGTTDVLGWTHVLSPSSNGASWSFSYGECLFLPGLCTYRYMQPYEAYWIQMENGDDLGGFSSTPLVLPPWAPTDD